MNSSDDEENAVVDVGNSRAPLIVNSRNHTESHSAVVNDRFDFVYLMFYLLGIGCLLPWNFFTNASRYFSYKLRNVTLNESSFHPIDASSLTESQILFLNYLELAALVPSVLFTFINIIVTNKISMKKRVSCSFLALLLLFMLTIILTLTNTNHWQKGFLYTSMATIILMNAAVAVLQGGLCGMAGKFPEKYMQSLMGGMALAGFFAALTSLIIISLGIHPINSGLSYFTIAFIVLLICFAGFLFLPKIKFASYYLNQPTFGKSANQDYVDIVVHSLTASKSKCTMFREIVDVFRQIWVFSLSSCLVFMITLTCYPALSSAIQSTSSNSTWREIYFSPVACFLVFNLFDVIGRCDVRFIRWPSINHPFIIGLLSLLRLSFIPAFFFCNIQPRVYTHPFFTSDWVPIILNMLLGWSNGHLITLCMMYAPRMVQSNQVELSGSIMTFSICAGLGLGSMLAMSFMRSL